MLESVKIMHSLARVGNKQTGLIIDWNQIDFPLGSLSYLHIEIS